MKFPIPVACSNCGCDFSALGYGKEQLPACEMPQVRRTQLNFMDEWYPIQVKQMDRVGRPDIDKFEAAMMRTRRRKGFFVGFDFSRDALTEIDAFFRREHIVIVALTVREILDETIAQRLA